MLLLAESVKEAPSEIEKEKNRATLRFGEAFQYGDYIAICSLQSVASELRSEFLELLCQAVESRDTDVAQLVDAADHGRYATIAALHDLKQRLVRSGCGNYHQPRMQAHPAFQTLEGPKHSLTSSRPRRFCSTPLQEQRYDLPSSEGGGSSNSANSDDASIHVHFCEEDTTLQMLRRRVSILGFLRHSRLRSGSLLVDSKRRSDELAERKMRDDAVLQRQMQRQDKENGPTVLLSD